MNIFNKMIAKKQKGFTIIELIVVIAVIGILVLLAMPRFLGYVDSSKLVRIQHDIKVVGDRVEGTLAQNKEALEKEKIETDTLIDLANENKLFDLKGKVVEREINGEMVIVPEDTYHEVSEHILKDAGTKLPGTFYAGAGGNIYYEHDKSLGSSGGGENPVDPVDPITKYTVTVQNGTGSGEYEVGDIIEITADNIEGNVFESWQSEDVVLDNEETTTFIMPESNVNVKAIYSSDFVWIKSSNENAYTAINEIGKGYYKYSGDDKTVTIPHIINGHPMTNYYNMFIGANIEKVISTNNNVTNMNFALTGIKTSKILDVSEYDTSSAISMESMFSDYFYKSSIEHIVGLNTLNTSNVVNMKNMFRGTNVKTLDLSNFDTSNVTDMNQMFLDSNTTSVNLSSFNTSKVTNMMGMFSNSKMTSLDISSFNTSSVVIMNGTRIHREDGSGASGSGYGFLEGAKASTVILGAGFDTTKVKSFGRMFEETDISNLNEVIERVYTPNATSMVSMFETSKYSGELDVSHFDTSKVLSMDAMFADTRSTSITGLQNFDTSKVETMMYMFAGNYANSLDLGGFNTSNVTTMHSMFGSNHATSLNLSSFNTSKVIDMSSMFNHSEITTLDLSSFDILETTNVDDMFKDTYITTAYAKTQIYADKLNSSSNIPYNLTFIAK